MSKLHKFKGKNLGIIFYAEPETLRLILSFLVQISLNTFFVDKYGGI